MEEVRDVASSLKPHESAEAAAGGQGGEGCFLTFR